MLRDAEDTRVSERKSEHQFASKCAGSALSWSIADGVIELALHREPCNELGSASLDEFEKFAAALEKYAGEGACAHYL